MTWLPRFIELAKKATKGPWRVAEKRHDYDQIIRSPKNDPIAIIPIAGYSKQEGQALVAYIASAYPERIIALGVCIEAGKTLDEAWSEKASIYAVSNARIVWKNALTRLDELEGK